MCLSVFTKWGIIEGITINSYILGNNEDRLYLSLKVKGIIIYGVTLRPRDIVFL